MKSTRNRSIILGLSIMVIIAVLISTPFSKNVLQWLAIVFLGIVAGIAAISEVIGLFNLKNRSENDTDNTNSIHKPKRKTQPKYIDKNIELFRTSVALWGPTYSGKSWLIKALSQSLTKKYADPISGLKYELKGINQQWDEYVSHLSKAPLKTHPDDIYDPIIFRFERRRTSSSRRESLSSFAHEISIIDYAGEYAGGFRGGVEGFINSDIGRMFNIADADIIIVALDPEQFTLSRLSKTEYANIVRQLFTVLSKINPHRKRFYAVCLMKTDVIPNGVYADPDGLIELIFGVEMIETLKNASGYCDIQTFATSSFGFIPNTTKQNFSDESQEIIDTKYWQPYGVEYPFFWAFEAIERTRIKQKNWLGIFDTINYIRYPKPRYELK